MGAGAEWSDGRGGGGSNTGDERQRDGRRGATKSVRRLTLGLPAGDT